MSEKPEQMIEDIQESTKARNGVELTAWEEEFLDSIDSQLGEDRRLSEKQLDVLQKIWERV